MEAGAGAGAVDEVDVVVTAERIVFVKAESSGDG